MLMLISGMGLGIGCGIIVRRRTALGRTGWVEGVCGVQCSYRVLLLYYGLYLDIYMMMVFGFDTVLALRKLRENAFEGSCC